MTTPTVTEEKICTGCQVVKPIEQFYRNSKGQTKGARCRRCVADATARWKAANPARVAEQTERRKAQLREPGYFRDRHLRRTYGIGVEDEQRMLSEQAGRCAICPATTDLVIDHDHATGRVRGILCRRCNAALGQMGDDTDRLMSAVAYLLGASR